MNTISFLGTYHIKATDNQRKSYDAVFLLPTYKMNGETITQFPPQEELHAIIVNDKYNKKVESFLKQKGVNFKKLSQYELTGEGEILKRMVLPKHNGGNLDELIYLNTAKFDECFKKSTAYIDRNLKGAIFDRIENFENYLKTGLEIEAPRVYLKEDENGLVADFLDGRHRYSYMRERCFEKIPFATNEKSLELAKKYNLLG